MRISRRGLGSILTVLVAALAAPSFPARADDAADWANLTEAAKKEGEVTFYNATGIYIAGEFAKRFEAATGIRVNVLNGTSAATRERVRAESASGRIIGDVVMSGESSMHLMQRAGLTTGHGALQTFPS